MVVSAVMGDLGGHGFARPADNAWKIEKSKRIMDLALDLDTHVITTHIGVVPDQDSHPPLENIVGSLRKPGSVRRPGRRILRH